MLGSRLNLKNSLRYLPTLCALSTCMNYAYYCVIFCLPITAPEALCRYDGHQTKNAAILRSGDRQNGHVNLATKLMPFSSVDMIIRLSLWKHRPKCC